MQMGMCNYYSSFLWCNENISLACGCQYLNSFFLDFAPAKISCFHFYLFQEIANYSFLLLCTCTLLHFAWHAPLCCFSAETNSSPHSPSQIFYGLYCLIPWPILLKRYTILFLYYYDPKAQSIKNVSFDVIFLLQNGNVGSVSGRNGVPDWNANTKECPCPDSSMKWSDLTSALICLCSPKL